MVIVYLISTVLMITIYILIIDETYDKSFKISMSIKGVTPQHEYTDIVKTFSPPSRYS